MEGRNVTGSADRGGCAPLDAVEQSPALPPATARVDGTPALRGAAPRCDYQPLLVLAIAAAAGITLDRQMHWLPRSPLGFLQGLFNPFAIWWGLGVFCLIAWWIARREARPRVGAWMLLAGAAFACASWHHLRSDQFGRHEIALFTAYDPQPACIEVIALEAPHRVLAPAVTPLRAIPAGDRSRLLVEVTGVRDGTLWRPAGGRCQLSVDGHLLGVGAGDRLRVFGQLGRPAPPRNPGEFDFAGHARADRQLAVMRSTAPESVTVTAQGGRWTIRRKFNELRSAALRLVREHVGPERWHLAAAILLGAREGLPYDETEPYLVTGTIHVLAA